MPAAFVCVAACFPGSGKGYSLLSETGADPHVCESQFLGHPGAAGRRRLHRAGSGSAGSLTEGDTKPEALADVEEAIRAVLAYRRDHGLAMTLTPL